MKLLSIALPLTSTSSPVEVVQVNFLTCWGGTGELPHLLWWYRWTSSPVEVAQVRERIQSNRRDPLIGDAQVLQITQTRETLQTITNKAKLRDNHVTKFKTCDAELFKSPVLKWKFKRCEQGCSHRQDGIRVFDAHIRILMHGCQI